MLSCTGPIDVTTIVFDDGVEPRPFVAVTLIEYEDPATKPLTVNGLPVPVAVIGAPPLVGVAVAVKEVTGFAALEVLLEKLTTACPLLFTVAVEIAGDSGRA